MKYLFSNIIYIYVGQIVTLEDLSRFLRTYVIKNDFHSLYDPLLFWDNCSNILLQYYQIDGNLNPLPSMPFY